MRGPPAFVQVYLSKAKALVKAGGVKGLVFSRGTYQIEVQEKGKKREFPFLQMQDDGTVTDRFCSCKGSEEEGCIHLAAAYLRIFNESPEPLHVRFKKSLWNRLFQMAAKRHGYSTDCLRASKGKYTCGSKTNKELVSIEALTAGAKKRLEATLSKRVEETEETSIKFSNLTAEEIAQYKSGQAGPSLRYELSFWADLAKWLMFLDDEKEPYKIEFDGSPVPHEMRIQFPQLDIWFYISEVNWPWIIPALHTVKAPLKVFDAESEWIERVDYDEQARQLTIHHREGKRGGEADSTGHSLGDWLYVEKKGFYLRKDNPMLQSGTIDEGRIAEALSSAKELRQFLRIHDEQPRRAQYKIHIDGAASLHVELYVEEEGDMRPEAAACFVPWAYVPGRGFFLLEDWLFPEKEKVVPKDEVAEFVNRHRLWLHQFPAFQTHLGSLESHLIYRVTEEQELVFDAELNFPEEDTISFDEWVYIKGQGFYMKKEGRGRLPLHPGLKIEKELISSFIDGHKEELEQVQGFFSSEPLIQKIGLSVCINEEGRIVLTPRVEYRGGGAPKGIQSFGHYLYLSGKGFFAIAPSMRLPERYAQTEEIAPAQETAFLAYELEPLKTYIVELDAKLQKPSTQALKIRKIVRDRKRGTPEWWVDLAYETDIGVIDVFSIWDAFQEKKRHLFSEAGLLFLKEPRYNWIRQLPRKKLDRKRGMVKLNTLEWIRLNVFEEIHPPRGSSEDEASTRTLLSELNRMEPGRLLDVSRLKATLRPYQEQGVHWLWFLYCHGLSGLLCDDMGLGKTHQTMALLAAVVNEDEDKRNKYLVVCPTSVIYHWQELLKRFLPDLRVCTYYGLERSLENFETHYDLLLTSYGILRTGRDNFRSISFEVAIFDEIQIAKNFASQTHKALRAINAQMCLGLTGTPIENRIRELKALIDIVLPSYMPSEGVFRELFIHPIEKQGDDEKKVLLGKLVKPFILRRRKSEVLRDLPEKIEEISYCDLSEEQKTMYREVALQMRDTVYRELKSGDKPISYVHVFSALSTMKRICDHPCLIHGDPKQYPHHASGKWDLFVELLQEARDSGQKVVVFSQYLEMIAIIEAHLKKKGIGYASIKGSTRDRSEQLRRFREDPTCEVFVASLLAAGIGIDLTVASIVIHYDRWWNPAKENQATDRVHRIGQNRGVQVFKLVTKNTIEEHIHALIERKKGLLEQIIGAEDQITYLSREELIQVFELMFKES